MPIRVNAPITGESGGAGFPLVSTSAPAGQHNLQVSVDSPSTDNAFAVEHVTVSGGVFNGTAPNGKFASNWPSNLTNNRTTKIMSGPNIASMAARLLANSNPSRAEVLLPTFVFELKDFPGMIKDAGYFLLGAQNRINPLKQLAAKNLALQFGWLPLISDLKKLADVPNLMAKRCQEIDRLNSGSGLKRRMELASDNAASSHTTYFSGWVQSGNIPILYQANARTWGTCKWHPAKLSSNNALRRKSPLAVSAAILGLRPDQISLNVWNALPWSWLVDYFSNFGDALAAASGRSVATPSGINIMTHISQTCTQIAAPAWLVGGNGPTGMGGIGTIKSDWKSRSPTTGVTLAVDFPILSDRQLSILGSLAMLRASGRH